MSLLQSMDSQRILKSEHYIDDNLSDGTCRLCLSNSGAMHPIFDQPHNNLESEFATKLKSCLHLKIEMGDGLPSNICETCLSKVFMFCEFYEQCKSSDIYLRKKCSAPITPQPLIIQGSTLEQTKYNPTIRELEDDWVEECSEVSQSNILVAGSPWRLSGSPKPEPVNKASSNSSDLCPIEDVQEEQQFLSEGSLFPGEPDNTMEIDASKGEDSLQSLSSAPKNENSDVDIYAGKISKDKEGRWMCNVCNTKIKSFHWLKKHVLEHFSSLSCVCVECKLTLPDRKSLERHVEKHNQISCSLGYSCSECGKLFHIKHLLNKHFSIEHCTQAEVDLTKSKETKDCYAFCGSCRREFYSSLEMEEHNLSCCENDDTSEDEDSAPSKTCSDSKDSQVKKRTVPPCYFCSLKFPTSRALTFHVREAHNCDSPFQCEVTGCGRVSSTYTKYRDHKKSHLRRFKCSLCTTSCRDKRDLDEHMNSHNNLRPFDCKLCGKAYMKRHHLRNHLNRHSCSKEYSCVQCGKNFQKSTQLSVHMLSHSSDRPFICEICGNCYKVKSSLAIHKGRKHKDGTHTSNV